jgi:hypothetical protein
MALSPYFFENCRKVSRSSNLHNHSLCAFYILPSVEDMPMRVLGDRYRDELGLSYADDGGQDQHCLGCKLWLVSPSLRARSRKGDMPQHEVYSTQCYRTSDHQGARLLYNFDQFVSHASQGYLTKRNLVLVTSHKAT